MSGRWQTGRVEAFSDGVFAIAITLLVLDLKIGPEELHDPWKALADEWPGYLAYVTSFLAIGGVWLSHHSFFVRLRYVDLTVMRLNLLLLMVVSFLPFPTSIMAEALHVSIHAERVAIIVYGLTLVVIEIVIRATIRYASQTADLLAEPMPDIPSPVPREVVGAVVYITAILFALLLFPRPAAFVYLGFAAWSVIVAR